MSIDIYDMNVLTLSNKLCDKLRKNGFTPFSYYWRQDSRLNNIFISVTNNHFIEIYGMFGEFEKLKIYKTKMFQ